MDRNGLLKHIEDAYLRGVLAKPDVIPSGPFVISINPTTKLRWLNNAVLRDDSVAVKVADVEEMVRVFKEHGRLPRMEVFRELRADLIETLQHEGFEIENELPVMVCTEETFVPVMKAEVSVEILSQASDPTPFMRVVDESFEHDEPITPERIEGMRQSLRRGSQWAALGCIEGEPAAVASLVVSDHVAELAGVGTVSKYRRRGAASTVSTKLMQEFFNHGDLVWLSAGDGTAQAVYERLGFALLGVQVNISKESVIAEIGGEGFGTP